MKLSNKVSLKNFLNEKVDEYNQPLFIEADPICIPHLFSKKQDIEIAGFFAATFAWGNRTTIINKSRELMQLMDNAPHQFCLNHNVRGLKRLMGFKHRTFNTTDLLYFIKFLKHHYSKNNSLESAFFNKQTLQIKASEALPIGGGLVGAALNHFSNYFFSLDDSPTQNMKNVL